MTFVDDDDAEGDFAVVLDLIGAKLRLQGGALLSLDAAKLVADTTGRSWWAHELSVRTGAGVRQPLCEPHVDGTRYAVVLPGREEPDGSLSFDPQSFAISCTTGALAKCLRLGYEPWELTPAGASMRATYNACVKMIRADYTGHGIPYTLNGRALDVQDAHSIQEFDRSTDAVFEAGWDEKGAVCVNYVRVEDKITLQGLADAVTRLRGNVGAICTEAHARALGALLFNRSALPPGTDQ